MCNTPSLSFNDWTYVAYSDLCGFKNMMENREEAYEALNHLFNSVYELLRDRQSIKGLAVSDCVISWAADKQLDSIVDFVGSLHKKMIHRRYLMRTTIAYGQFEFQQRIQLINLGKQMIWGGAYLAAYLGNERVKPGSIGFLDEHNIPNTEASLCNWRWKRQSYKNGTLHEYYWAANKREDIHLIRETKRLRKKQERYEALKNLYNSLVLSRPVSNIRKRGLAYLKKVFGHMPSDPVAVSKFFKAKESWTKKPAWWFDLPIRKVKNNRQGAYYLVGKARKSGFVVFRVPNKFFISNLRKFETRYRNRIRLHITVEGENQFIDERGNDRVDFGPFKQKL